MKNHTLYTGIEGSRKSISAFELLKDQATVDRPLLIGVRNYVLMSEQIRTWCDVFDLDPSEFSICGFGKKYEPAMDAYTNPEFPYIVPEGVRFIFLSQANIQRCNHYNLMHADRSDVTFCHILIDEFEFLNGIIPSAHYQVQAILDGNLKHRTVESLLAWVEASYTLKDKLALTIGYKLAEQSFYIAEWIRSSPVEITFLSSEKLVEKFFALLGFDVIKLGVDTFEHNVNLFPSPLINKNFFKVMNKEVVWDRLSYDLIISDCINGYYQDNELAVLDTQVISHQGIRGSNVHRGKNILTVISHVPQQCIVFIKDVLSHLGEELSYKDVEYLFYRDRLCQAVGRVLGYRAILQEGTVPSTDVVVHSSIYDALKGKPFPYVFKEWDFNFDGKDVVFQQIKTRQNIAGTKPYRSKAVQSLSYLDAFFRYNENSNILVSQIKPHLIANFLKPVPATKIAKYFGCSISNKKVAGSPRKIIKGLEML